MQDELPGRRGTASLIQYLERTFARKTSEAIVHGSSWERYNYRTLIQEADVDADVFFLILNGGVKIIKTEFAQTQILDIAGPMEIIGAPLILGEAVMQKFPVQIETLARSEVLKISKLQYHKELKFFADFGSYFSAQIKTRIDRLQKEVMTRKWTVEARLADFIMNRLNKIQDIRMTRAELAQVIGSTGESVIRVLSHWEKSGVLVFKQQLLVSVNEQALLLLMKQS